MGFKQIEIVPTQSPSPLTPAGKSPKVKLFQISRSDTVATLKAMLPANSTLIDFSIATTDAPASGTATLDIGTASGTVTNIVNAADVATGTHFRPALSGVHMKRPVDNNAGDVALWARFAGTAVTGGPWTVAVTYA